MTNTESITLVLLPGMDGTGKLFDPLLRQLPSHIKPEVIRYPTTDKLSYQALTELAREQVPRKQPYLLLGESFSGPIAISLAASADTQLKGVILSCTFARNPRQFLSKFGVLVPRLPINAWSMPLLNQLLMGSFKDSDISNQLFEAVSQVSPEVMRYRLDEVMHVDETQALKNISKPILYLQGKEDYLVPASAALTIMQLAKQAEMIAIDAPHLLLQVAAKEAARHILQFAQKVS
ncbi:MAG TPA: alpha/beta hydrolase [Methylotenera sp.]|nr:alpha/beta hydrolase [Methylotenera sp.]HPH05463.1 alpha/beta hydrolase [Methylotenera sp.]HPN01400.1 alpha/beta hydrolase [Methylotenera sp.]